jgi:EAL domain-containing protein (putative c-di-GMP-specific phosphodiesterase class I)
MVVKRSRWAASRLNGSDFALLAPRAVDPRAVAEEMQGAIREIFESRSMDRGVTFPAASTIYAHGDTFSGLMTLLDGALQAADREGESAVNIAHKGDIPLGSIKDQLEEWREVFSAAFRDNLFSLEFFPVVNQKSELLHYEAPVRLDWQGKTLAAGQFLPWINRLELSGELDKEVVTTAIDLVRQTGKPLCANLSVASVVERDFLDWLSASLSREREAAANLWLEVPESMAFRHLDNFKLLCKRAKAHGSKVGIEHMGHQLAELGQLHDVGLDYLKVDASFVRDIENNVANQTLLRTLCTIGHSIGVIVIAEGVRTKAEWDSLRDLGVDGATGPGIMAE